MARKRCPTIWVFSPVDGPKGPSSYPDSPQLGFAEVPIANRLVQDFDAGTGSSLAQKRRFKFIICRSPNPEKSLHPFQNRVKEPARG
jgi:hypothetical protein